MYPPAGGGMRDPVDIEPEINSDKNHGSLSTGFLPPVEKTVFYSLKIYFKITIVNIS
jgi:hypothetical protein